MNRTLILSSTYARGKLLLNAMKKCFNEDSLFMNGEHSFTLHSGDTFTVVPIKSIPFALLGTRVETVLIDGDVDLFGNSSLMHMLAPIFAMTRSNILIYNLDDLSPDFL